MFCLVVGLAGGGAMNRGESIEIKLVLAGVILALANAAYELFLPLLNTRDPVDAAYGVGGTLLAFAWLWLVRRFGLKALPAAV